MTDRFGWSLATSVIASIGTAAGCAVPLVLVLAGIGGTWLSSLHRMQRFMPVFVIASIAALGYAAWNLFGKAKMSDACQRGPARHTRRALFWFVLVLNAGMLLAPLVILYIM
jgi:mercuric ion transport protein